MSASVWSTSSSRRFVSCSSSTRPPSKKYQIVQPTPHKIPDTLTKTATSARPLNLNNANNSKPSSECRVGGYPTPRREEHGNHGALVGKSFTMMRERGARRARLGAQIPAISTASTSAPYFFSLASPMPEMRPRAESVLGLARTISASVASWKIT